MSIFLRLDFALTDLKALTSLQALESNSRFANLEESVGFAAAGSMSSTHTPCYSPPIKPVTKSSLDNRIPSCDLMLFKYSFTVASHLPVRSWLISTCVRGSFLIVFSLNCRRQQRDSNLVMGCLMMIPGNFTNSSIYLLVDLILWSASLSLFHLVEKRFAVVAQTSFSLLRANWKKKLSCQVSLHWIACILKLQ